MIKTDIYTDSDGKPLKIFFDMDLSTQVGVLKIPHETHLCYDYILDTWFGDEINADGWVDLPDEEITYLVTTHKLTDYLI